MRKELKKAVNPLEELLIIIKQYFQKLVILIDNPTDTRNQSYVKYDLKVCLLTQILTFCSGYQSINKIGRNFNLDIIKTLIRSKMLERYRFNGLFHITIDSTNLYSTRVNLDEQSITKTYNKDQDNEYTLFSYYALEVKLVCDNLTFPLATEFVENETYTDKS